MTTDRITIRSESVDDWPVFAGASGVPQGLEVTSVEVRRLPHESVAFAAAEGSNILGAALRERLLPGQDKIYLVALGSPIRRSTRLTTFVAERDKLWNAMKRTEVPLPNGVFTEFEIASYDDTLRFGGIAEFTVNELPVALEVTRRENAVCVGSIGKSLGVDLRDVLQSSESFAQNSQELMCAVFCRIPKGVFVAMSSGQFDDSVIFTDVYADASTLEFLRKSPSLKPQRRQ